MIDDTVFLTTLTSQGDSNSSPAPAILATISADMTESTLEGFSNADNSFALNATDFTIAGWFKQKINNTNRNIAAFKTGAETANLSWSLSTVFIDRIRFFTSNGSVSAAADSNIVTLGTTNWHFFMARYRNSDNLMEISLDDGTKGTATGNDPQAQTANLTIGHTTGTGPIQSDFLATCFGIWTRRLTDAQVTALFNLGNDARLFDDLTTAEKINLKAYWNFNETSDGSIQVDRLDSSGNSFTLTDLNTVPSAVDAP